MNTRHKVRKCFSIGEFWAILALRAPRKQPTQCGSYNDMFEKRQGLSKTRKGRKQQLLPEKPEPLE
jgi:hypothetical protein